MTTGHGVDAFVVLMDHDGRDAVAGLPFPAERLLCYRSGWPCVVARLRSARATVVREGDRALLVIGPGPLSAGEQERVSSWLRGRSTDSSAVVARLPGVHHTVALLDDEVHVQGTASGLRRLYSAGTGSATLVSDRADVLAVLTGAEVSDAALVLRLVEPVYHPMRDTSMWHGVRAVPPGSRLEPTRAGAPRVVPYWTPPEPVRPLEEGAEAVLEALTASVETHVRGRDRVLTELSGGFDSTAVTALAHRAVTGQPGRTVLAVTEGNRGPLNNDESWARRAAAGLPGLEHVVVPAGDVPLVCSELLDAELRLDEPSVAVASRGTLRALSELARDASADVHLTGHGGDHLFMGIPALARDLLPRRPIAAARRVSAYGALFSWPRRQIARQLLDRRGYGAWLAGALDPSPVPDHQVPTLTWGFPAAVPPWLSPHGRELVHGAFAEAALQAQPLAPTRGRHLELDTVLEGTRLVRALVDLSSGFGMPIGTPFFDDRVVEAALSVVIHARVDPWRYKPLLATAVRGVVPDAVLTRTTKDEGSFDVEAGLHAHAAQVHELFKDSRLAARGFIDLPRVRALAADPSATDACDGALLTTIACEVWLRSLEGPARERGQIHALSSV